MTQLSYFMLGAQNTQVFYSYFAVAPRISGTHNQCHLLVAFLLQGEGWSIKWQDLTLHTQFAHLPINQFAILCTSIQNGNPFLVVGTIGTVLPLWTCVMHFTGSPATLQRKSQNITERKKEKQF